MPDATVMALGVVGAVVVSVGAYFVLGQATKVPGAIGGAIGGVAKDIASAGGSLLKDAGVTVGGLAKDAGSTIATVGGTAIQAGSKAAATLAPHLGAAAKDVGKLAAPVVANIAKGIGGIFNPPQPPAKPKPRAPVWKPPPPKPLIPKLGIRIGGLRF